MASCRFRTAEAGGLNDAVERSALSRRVCPEVAVAGPARQCGRSDGRTGLAGTRVRGAVLSRFREVVLVV